MINGIYSTMKPTLKVINGTVTLNNESEKVENLFIHVSDYGDSYFDICLCNKENEKALAGTGWDIIHIGELESKLTLLSTLTGIQDIKKERIH